MMSSPQTQLRKFLTKTTNLQKNYNESQVPFNDELGRGKQNSLTSLIKMIVKMPFLKFGENNISLVCCFKKRD